MNDRKNFTLNTQKGFTLVEIIAVLVILGIIGAMAASKYMNLQDQARIESGSAAISEVKTRLKNAYGQYLLANKGVKPKNIKTLCNFINNTDILPKNGNGAVPMGSDYTVTMKNTGVITVTHVQGVKVKNLTDTWKLPN